MNFFIIFKSYSLYTSVSVVVFVWETYHFMELRFVLFFILFNRLFHIWTTEILKINPTQAKFSLET